MTDFWSRMFLLVILVLGSLFALIILLMVLAKYRNRLIIKSMVGIVATLLSIWIVDRFIVGAFCLPWECISRDIALETFLLNEEDLPDDWDVRQTFDYAYIERASLDYIERTFHTNLSASNDVLFQQIYQYRSIRGAEFQYNALKLDLPMQYFVRDAPASQQINLQDNHAVVYTIECLYGSENVCYYVAQYDEYLLVIEMPVSPDSAFIDDFVELVRLADVKFYKTLQDSRKSTSMTALGRCR